MFSRRSSDRRQLLRAAGLGMLGVSASGWLPAFAQTLAGNPHRRRHCILLWMSGGPSQMDTFDMKPNHENGGEFREISTSVPGLRFSEHLPQLAKQADQLAIIRSLSTKEGDHSRGTYLMRTGKKPLGPIQYPAIGASLANALGLETDRLPNYVSIGPFRAVNQEAFGPGFLGPRFSPLVIGARDNGFESDQTMDQGGFATLKVASLDRQAGVSDARMQTRLDLWRQLQSRFLQRQPQQVVTSQNTVYESAVDLLTRETVEAFDLSEERDELRRAYGTGLFGQGCLMARRLIERGTAFVEVTLDGWDTHADNFSRLTPLIQQLDSGWATLMTDLRQRGLLEDTTILWMGEFGRTPQINGAAGRDHFPRAWSCVLAGGGVAGGQTYGRTSDDGTRILDNPVDCPNVLATVCAALGVDPGRLAMSTSGRPIPIVDGLPIKELVA